MNREESLRQAAIANRESRRRFQANGLARYGRRGITEADVEREIERLPGRR